MTLTGRYWDYLPIDRLGPLVDAGVAAAAFTLILIASRRRSIGLVSIVVGSLSAATIELIREFASGSITFVGWPEFVDSLALVMAAWLLVASPKNESSIGVSRCALLAALSAAMALRMLKQAYIDIRLHEISERFDAAFFMLTWVVMLHTATQLTVATAKRLRPGRIGDR